eukprot:CAMPEP_0204397144 /NCGR_PEP_ID=MMETSP0470-20130426/1930_1 /ASSEMBLY_ACC=CAM_ASM_000385 /TAXON_ID=2969 /ORGANISM="Oxyrrhis marina" /LENGTH=49 /DNA_ID= /DNA_START= /DNA_END= /DNA_ORIENTATION=
MWKGARAWLTQPDTASAIRELRHDAAVSRCADTSELVVVVVEMGDGQVV